MRRLALLLPLLTLTCGDAPATSTETDATETDAATQASSEAGSSASGDGSSASEGTEGGSEGTSTAGPTSDGTGEATDDTAATSDGETETTAGSFAPVSFAVIGDTPYEDEDELALVEHLAALNELGGASFLVHVGDIKRGAPPCVESEYTDIRGWLLELVAPVFIIPGDNEWNDCDDPDEAWAFWWQHLQALDESWPDAPAAARQPERLENFAFVERGVLFVGINLVGGAVHDIAEWQTRLAQDADWVEGQLAAHAGELYAVVVFGHANPSSAHAGFTTPFAEIVASAGLPTLFVHGDGHEWLNTPGYLGVEALRRVQVECCSAKPLLVTVDPEAAEPFTLERDPF